MAGRLPRVTARQIIAVLGKVGFILVRQSGSHRIYRNESGRRATVPLHPGKILHPKLLRSVLKDADMSVEELRGLLRKIKE